MISSSTPPYRQYVPRSISDRDYWHRAATLSAFGDLKSQLQTRVEQIPDIPTFPPASDYLAALRHNNRTPVDVYWHRTLTYLADLTLLRCIDGDVATGVDDKLLNWLFAAATQPSWVLAAHLPGFDLPLTGAPQLDLIACEVAASLAEMAQMLQPWIQNQSKTLLQSIVNEIDRRVLEPFVSMENHWWYDNDPKRAWNNWAGVCAGSILVACESLAAIGQPRPAAREKALRVLNTFLQRAFTPAGECDEGIGYWSYGLSMACLGWSRLDETEFRNHVDTRRLKQVADYPEQVHLIGRCFFSGNDAPLTATLPAVTSAYLAGAAESAWLLQWVSPAEVSTWDSRDLCIAARLIDSLLNPSQSHDTSLSRPAASRFVHDQQVAIFQHNGLSVCLSGGTNAEAHNHNDLGQFIVLKDDQLIIIDIGAPSYTADFFGPKRYTYLSTSSRGHCCPIINGQEQFAGADAKATVLDLDLDKQSMRLDLTRAYPADACLTQWIRSVRRDEEQFVFTDEFTTSSAVPVESLFWSMLEPTIAGHVIRIGQVTITLQPAAEIKVEAIDPKPHRLRNVGDRIYRISLNYTTTASEALTVSWSVRAT